MSLISKIESSETNFGLDYAAQKLRVPAESIRKLRRVLDPDLSFEEHRDIFPLDLGEIWDLAAFSATKKASAVYEGGSLGWKTIEEQFQDIFYYGLMKRHSEIRYTCKQSDLKRGYAQLNDDLHVDGDQYDRYAWRHAFKNNWRSPRFLVLVARDVGPTTIFINGFKKPPFGVICKGPRNAAFHNRYFLRLAKLTGKCLVARNKHVTAFTDRNIHAGQPVLRDMQQTFAAGYADLYHLGL